MVEKKKNPLYVVTEKGSVVEEAESIIDAFIKKYNLQPFLDILDKFVEIALAQVNSYAGFVAVKNVIDQFIDKLLAYLGRFQGLADKVKAFAL